MKPRTFWFLKNSEGKYLTALGTFTSEKTTGFPFYSELEAVNHASWLETKRYLTPCSLENPLFLYQESSQP